MYNPVLVFFFGRLDVIPKNLHHTQGIYQLQTHETMQFFKGKSPRQFPATFAAGFIPLQSFNDPGWQLATVLSGQIIGTEKHDRFGPQMVVKSKGNLPGFAGKSGLVKYCNLAR